MRLPDDAPVRTALIEYDRPLKMSRGARKFTWGKNINNDLPLLGLDRHSGAEAAKVRKGWRGLVNGIHTAD